MRNAAGRVRVDSTGEGRVVGYQGDFRQRELLLVKIRQKEDEIADLKMEMKIIRQDLF